MPMQNYEKKGRYTNYKLHFMKSKQLLARVEKLLPAFDR